MDAVRISHLRIFANAVSMALEGANAAPGREKNLTGLLGAFHRSMQASHFFDAPSQDAALPAVLPENAKLPPAQAVPMTPVFAAAVVPVQAAMQASLASQPAVQLALTHASQFFVRLPWTGMSLAQSLDVITPTQVVSTPVHAADVAVQFFALLPWTSAAHGNRFSIEPGQRHPEQAQRVAALLGRSALPAAFSLGAAMPSTASAGMPLAAGFFARVPWAGTPVFH